MPDSSQQDSLQRVIRQRFSHAFWKAWQKLPISGERRQRVIVFVFSRLPFLVSWTASYRNWKQEAERLSAQAARLEALQKASPGDNTGHMPRYVELSARPRPGRLLARAVAFYLPQFHAIPENDRWWGKGFTEWTNVRRARPQFQGHRQPRRPAELGYYDLMDDPAIRRRQASLAYQYGLEAFCFYFYWFGGKRLLDGPIQAYAADQEINFPFCLCWANESWSRRWDGREDQKLITQYHSPEDDIAFISHIADYLRSDKYLKVNSKPLVIVYRPDLLPDPRATADRWRRWCRENDIGEIYLAYTLSFANGTPDQYGFDAAIEFPPNNMGLAPRDGLTQPVTDGYACKIYDLQELAERTESASRASYRLFRGVTPQWDNTARRMNHAAVMLDTGPAGYERWLRNAASLAAETSSTSDERIVFINAWNEWAEGAYLEPDLEWGYAWLNATRNALAAEKQAIFEPGDLVPASPMLEREARPKVIVVVHDLSRNGAQIHSLHLAASYRERFGYEVTTIACGDGPLGPNFECYGPLIRVAREITRPDDIRQAVAHLSRAGYRHAIINSSAGGWLAPYLAEAGVKCVGLVHELPDIVRRMKLESCLDAFDRHAQCVIFPSDFVRKGIEEEFLRRPCASPVILPQGHYKKESVQYLEEKQVAAEAIKLSMGLAEDAILVVGVGYGDHRKGIDLFCEWAIATAREDSRYHFIWVGGLDPDIRESCFSILANAGDVAENMHFAGYQSDTAIYYRAASAYALSSREDPFPSTVLEALACGTPAFIVDGTTGLTDLAGSPAVINLPDNNPGSVSASIRAFLYSPETRDAAALAGINLVRQDFGFTSFAGDLLRLAGAFQPRISVIVPNYNYARFLPHRIASILNQEMPVWEIIFLDDASTDDSLAVAERLLKDCGIHYRIVPNTENSGSVFAQWQKGVKLARGDIVWIAEADDWAAASFTRIAAQAFRDEDVVISYTQSNQVSQDSEILCPHYLDYVADISRERWRSPFIHDGAEELAEGLSVKNTIPNVSGVLFQRGALARTLSTHMKEIRAYRVAGDWCVYAHLAAMGKIAFDPRPLNYHRRHASSVTISRFTQAEWDEIARMQARVRALTEVPETLQKTAQAYLDELAKLL